MTKVQGKAVELQKEIEAACIKHGLNLTIYDGKIGFVDQTDRKIVMLWKPTYKMGGTQDE